MLKLWFTSLRTQRKTIFRNQFLLKSNSAVISLLFAEYEIVCWTTGRPKVYVEKFLG